MELQMQSAEVWLDDLPDEVLLQILSHVPARDLVLSARCVSRRWRQLVADRSVWRRVDIVGKVGQEDELLKILRFAPAARELRLFLGDRAPTAVPDAVLRGVKGATRDVRTLSVGSRHFARNPDCFVGVLRSLADAVDALNVELIGVEAPMSTPAEPRAAPVFAVLAGMTRLRRLRLRALFDPCWYFHDLRSARHALEELDVAECESYLERLLSDLLRAHRATLRRLAVRHRAVRGRVLHALRDCAALRDLELDFVQQDDPLLLPAPAVTGSVTRLTLTGMNRRLPASTLHDSPSASVDSVAEHPWASVESLRLRDCLLSHSDVTRLLRAFPSVQRLEFQSGCFLGSPRTLADLVDSKVRLSARGLRWCERDPITGVYPLAADSRAG